MLNNSAQKDQIKQLSTIRANLTEPKEEARTNLDRLTTHIDGVQIKLDAFKLIWDDLQDDSDDSAADDEHEQHPKHQRAHGARCHNTRTLDDTRVHPEKMHRLA